MNQIYPHVVRRNPLVVFLAVVAVMGVCSGQLFAQAPVPAGKPVYDPSSKSYFELVSVYNEGARVFTGRLALAANWGAANKLAQERVYKGVHGRLAVIRTPDTYYFLLRTFQSRDIAWIGMRYWCATRTLEWVDGQIQTRTDFQAWARDWDNSLGLPGSGCNGTQGGERPYMPVAISPVTQGFEWFAHAGAKEYNLYFVQYPTGQP